MFEAVSQLAAEHAELEVKLADPSVHSDQSLARKLGQRYAELTRSCAPTRSGSSSARTSRPRASSPARTSRSPPRPRSSTRARTRPRSGCATC